LPHQRELTYLGDDRLLVALLRTYFPELETVWYPDLASVSWDNWNRIVIIDAGPDSYEMLLGLREISAGTPAILLVGPEDYQLTHASVAYHGGAEAVFCKPICRPNLLIECIVDCNRRLDHWQTHFDQSDITPDNAQRYLATARAEEHQQKQRRMIDELCLRVIGRQLSPGHSPHSPHPAGSETAHARVADAGSGPRQPLHDPDATRYA